MGVLELVLGRTIDAELERHGPLAPARAIRIARQLASALAEAHAIGIFHRDLKVANVILSCAPDGARIRFERFALTIARNAEESARPATSRAGTAPARP